MIIGSLEVVGEGEQGGEVQTDSDFAFLNTFGWSVWESSAAALHYRQRLPFSNSTPTRLLESLRV